MVTVNELRMMQLCLQKASQVNRDVRSHTWNLCSVKHKTKIFMEKDTKPAWPTSHEEKHIQGNHDLICIGTLPTPHAKLFLINKEDK